MITTSDPLNFFSEKELWDLLNTIPDPEVPAISIVELGVVREIVVYGDSVTVSITPTYSGCPALKMMEEQVLAKLESIGVKNPTLKLVYKPAWTTDWLSESTKEKLKSYGIAPPPKITPEYLVPMNRSKEPLECPFCNSMNTKLTSQFGSTACKSLHFCNQCIQPFEHFKCH